MEETRVPSLGWEDPLEKETATHCSILAWEIPKTEEPGGLQSVGHKESDTMEQLTLCIFKDLFSYVLLSASDFPFQVLLHCCACAPFLLTRGGISYAETLPSIFLEDGLISSSEASFPLHFSPKELLPVPPLLEAGATRAHTQGSSSTQKEMRKVAGVFSSLG